MFFKSRLIAKRIVAAFVLGFAVFSTTLCAAASPAGAKYVVVADRSAAKEWRSVALALAKKHSAAMIECNCSEGLEKLLSALKKSKPRYVCFVVPPEHAGRRFVRNVHRLMRRIDKDRYGDAIWGIITGYCPEDAMRTVRAPAGRTGSSIATSMGGDSALNGWASGFASDERTSANFWLKRRAGKTEKIPTGGNIAKTLAKAFNSMPVDYFVTSGHASERDWQIIYNKNEGSLLHTPRAGLVFIDPRKMEKYPLVSASLKVYIGAGNCLIGHVDGRASMATAWMHSAGVEEFAGYTVPSWYGFMGWGVKDLFESGRYSLAEACYLENQRLLWARMRAKDRINTKGLEYDSDVFVYYGDPAQRIMFPRDVTPYKISVKHDRVCVEFIRDCTMPPLDDVKGSRPVVALLAEPPPGDALFDASGREVKHAEVSERFLFIPAPGHHRAGEKLFFKIKAQNLRPSF